MAIAVLNYTNTTVSQAQGTALQAQTTGYSFQTSATPSTPTNPTDLPSNAGVYFVEFIFESRTSPTSGSHIEATHSLGMANSRVYRFNSANPAPTYAFQTITAYGVPAYTTTDEFGFDGFLGFTSGADGSADWTRAAVLNFSAAPALAYFTPFAGKDTAAADGKTFSANVRYMQITGVSPSSGGSGTAVTISGIGFTTNNGNRTVTFGGVVANNIVYVNDTTITCTVPSGLTGLVDVTLAADNIHVQQFSTTLSGGFSATQWWTHPTYGWYRSQAGSPSLDAQPTDPAPSSLGWLWDTWTTTTAPTGSGWWFSDSDYGGAATLIAAGRPANPRLYTEINAFATGSTAMLGGSPGAGCVFNNHLVYAKGGYTVGTDYPTIRVWDGTFDRQLAIVPPTSAGAVPKGVMSFLAANGTIYVSTLDSGTDSTTYTGRVFELDFESGVLSQVGAVFPTGHVPYALAWYNGQLFCGTHRRTPSAAGRVYKFRTDFTTSTWVLDRDLTSDSVGGVTSMLSFQGTLFVGTDANAATFAKILARDYAGTYTTSDTGSGGTAVANNGFLSMVEFSSSLYVGYWNNDATAITKIRKYNGASWSTAYTGAAGTLRPLIGFVVDDGYIFAIGGGLSLSAIVLRSSDGASWTDLTAQVTSASSFTAVPVFGVIVL